jgi:hypothetical protein
MITIGGDGLKRKMKSDNNSFDNVLSLSLEASIKVASLIYRDIPDYVSENEDRYLEWLKENELNGL